MQTVRVVRVVETGGRGASAAWRTVSSQPGWVGRAVAGIFVLVLVVPFLLLLLLALFAATMLFLVLAGINAIGRTVRGAFGSSTDGGGDRGAGLGSRPGTRDQDGRRNVRVIRRDV